MDETVEGIGNAKGARHPNRLVTVTPNAPTYSVQCLLLIYGRNVCLNKLLEGWRRYYVLCTVTFLGNASNLLCSNRTLISVSSCLRAVLFNSTIRSDCFNPCSIRIAL